MKLLTLLALTTTALAASSQNPLVSLLSEASAQLKSVESALSTTNTLYESLLSVAASRVSQATASLATNPSSAQIYSSLVSQYSAILNGATATAASELGSITATGSAAPVVTATQSAQVSKNAAPAAANDVVRVGAMGVLGAGVLGLAAFL